MVLVVGIGNTLRRDDGAGCFFAEALAAELVRAGVDVTLELHHQLAPELAEDATELAPQAIIFVDASVTVQSPVLTPLVADMNANPASHSLTPAALLAILRQLYAVDVAGWLVQTPAEDFRHGEGLSAIAQRGVDDAQAVAATIVRSGICP